MTTTTQKLIVEIAEAHNLLPKDGMGTSSPYARVDFDGQRRKTRTVPRDLNPTWNETLEFNLLGGVNTGLVDVAAGEPLEVNVFHDTKVGPSRRNCFLGRVKLDSRHFVKKGEEALMYFPLEKRSFIGNWVRGEIGLKVYYVDEPVPELEPVPPDAPAQEATVMEQEASPLPSPAEVTPSIPTQDDTSEPVKELETSAPPPTEDETNKTENPPPAGDENHETNDGNQNPPPTENENHETKETNEEPPVELPVPPPVADAPPPPPPPSHQGGVATPNWITQPRQVRQRTEATNEVMETVKHDLVDKMLYLFIRVVRARSLPGNTKPHVRISAYGRHVSTREARRGAFFEWDQTFAFSKDPSNDSSTMEISVWDLPPDSDVADPEDQQFHGEICFDIAEIPMRDPPDSALATQWYHLEGSSTRRGGDLMLSTWVGTQADASFADAWKADSFTGHFNCRSKIYLSPKLWYLRFTVIEAQETLTAPTPRESSIIVKATIGFQVMRTRGCSINHNGSPSWNEDLLFVAAEPFEDERLVISLEIRQGKELIVVGSTGIPLSSIERRVDDRRVTSRWLDLVPNDDIKKRSKKAAAYQLPGRRLHVRICLDGGYHVADEPSYANSDFRPSARQIWQPPIGIVELGLIGCKRLLPMRMLEGKGSTDVYAVAKYGPKWARTRTVPDCFDPAWNEQYTWPVYDPCTVLTIGVFDDPPQSNASPKDMASMSRPLGKVRIRISSLETGRIYRGSYPLIMMLPTGAKRMGEIELAIRFATTGPAAHLLHVYGQPTLPLMHFLRPIPAAQSDALRLAAVRLTTTHFAQSEPPLRHEVATWMLDATDHPRGFSMRKVRANWNRIVSALSWVVEVVRWIENIRIWRNPTATMLAHGVLLILTWFPELIVPTLALYVTAIGVWKYRSRLKGPVPHPCTRASLAEITDREELDEEFDPVPSVKSAEVVKARYDRARMIGAKLQGMLGEVAVQAERVQALVTWRDPRATGLFLVMCVVIALVLYMVPSRVVAVVAAFYYLRHPMFRDQMPSRVKNFFRRLPSLSERII